MYLCTSHLDRPGNRQVLSSLTGGASITYLSSIARIICVNTEQGWRWIYYILAIISFLGAVIQFFCYFPPRFDQLHRRSSRKETVKHLDYIGLVILVGSVTGLLLGISWGGQRYGTSPLLRKSRSVLLIVKSLTLRFSSMEVCQCDRDYRYWGCGLRGSRTLGSVTYGESLVNAVLRSEQKSWPSPATRCFLYISLRTGTSSASPALPVLAL